MQTASLPKLAVLGPLGSYSYQVRFFFVVENIAPSQTSLIGAASP
jgi:hypothetical protein